MKRLFLVTAWLIILSATLIPSIPAEVIPPAKPAPRHRGEESHDDYPTSVFFALIIFTGAEVLVSGPLKSPSASQKP